MFAITSDVVHFNPRIILRNAWGKSEDRFEHSVANFSSYYSDFCRTYSLYFFCSFVRAFSRDLAFSDGYLIEVDKLERGLNEKLRWPEAVTFEEMNIEGPADVVRVLMKMSTMQSKGEVASQETPPK